MARVRLSSDRYLRVGDIVRWPAIFGRPAADMTVVKANTYDGVVLLHPDGHLEDCTYGDDPVVVERDLDSWLGQIAENLDA